MEQRKVDKVNQIITSVGINTDLFADLLKISRISGESISSIMNEALEPKIEELKIVYPEYTIVNVNRTLQKKLKQQQRRK